MRKLTSLLFAASLLVSCVSSPKEYGAEFEFQPPTGSLGAWEMPARQVSVRGDNLTNAPLGQVTGAYAPTNTLQAYFEWIDDNWPSGVDTNVSYYFVDGTTQSFWRVVVRDSLWASTNITAGNSIVASNDLQSIDDTIVGDDLIVEDDGYIGNDLFVGDDVFIGDALTVTGAVDIGGALTVSSFTVSSNDMAVGYLGYPKLTLSSDDLTIYTGGGTTITTARWDNAVVDSSVSTIATGSLGNAVDQLYEVDLGEQYEGFASLSVRLNAGSGESMIARVYGARDRSVLGAQLIEQYERSGGVYASDSSGSTNRFTVVVPVMGQYVNVWVSQGADGGAQEYEIFDLSVYGTTNGYRNMGGF